VGASALCWVLWLSRTDVLFQRTVPNSYLFAGNFQGIYWARCWSQLSNEEEKVSLKRRSCILKSIMEFYIKYGWNFRSIGASSDSAP
jgi:hypothetical protein